MFAMRNIFLRIWLSVLACKLISCLPFCLICMVKRDHFINTLTIDVSRDAVVWFVGVGNERLFLENVSITT